MAEFISVIVPVYNEEKRLSKNIMQIIDYFYSNFEKYEIIFINDGSTDKTEDICKRFSKEKNIRTISNKKNMGKGFSVKKGILNSRGDIVLFTDCDLSTPLEHTKNFIKYIENYDIVIGSRALADSEVKYNLIKKVFGRIGNFFISFLVKEIKDTQCGFKLFKRECAQDIFSKQTINGWGFDFEILYLAQKSGYMIKEIPVKWMEDSQSKVRISDYPKTFYELIKIKNNEIKGVYK